jgi:RNA polymerase primary sigma factor
MQNEGMASKDSRDILMTYCDDIGAFSLLSAEDEVELFKRVEYGDPEAFKDAVESNLRMVVKIAKKFSKYDEYLGLTDRIQEGNIGLIEAVSRFDYRKGNRFYTYAKYWVKKAILEALAGNRLIRIQSRTISLFKRLCDAEMDLLRILDRKPSIAEKAVYIGISEEIAIRILIEVQSVVSLNELLSDDDSDEFGYMQENMLSPSPSRLTEEADLKKKLHQAIEVSLSQEESKFLFMRIRDDFSDREISDRLGMQSAVEVRNIFDGIVKKLQSSTEIRKLL